MTAPLLEREGTGTEIIRAAPDFGNTRVRMVVFAAPIAAPAMPKIAVDEGDALGLLLENCRVDTGIPDLAAEHDHSLHGTPKRGAE